MYSMILMAAMTTAPDLPEARSHGGHGCASSCSASCAPASCGGGRHHKQRGHHGGGCGSSCGGCGSTVAGCGGGGGPAGCGGCGGYAMADGMAAPMVAWSGDAPATIVVTGAADAKITLNDYVTTSRGDTRVLVTPQLAAGGTYHYDFKVETVRDGQRVAINRTVTVRPGVTTEVQLDLANNAVVMK